MAMMKKKVIGVPFGVSLNLIRNCQRTVLLPIVFGHKTSILSSNFS